MQNLPLDEILISLAVFVLIGMQLWAICKPYEDWPLGANIMFGYGMSRNRPLYDLSFHLQFPNGLTRLLDPKADLGIWEAAFKRGFFSKYYGSTDPKFAQGCFPNDSAPEFQRRLGSFCELMIQVLARRGIQVAAIRIEVSPAQNTTQKTASRIIFRYPERTLGSVT